ncbi:hypothetical protein LCGC14_1014030 [marine sediment metagenome]|uniref:Glutamine amidotransferase type-2 domain-containing protein n=1 Tax=marine sediment metagenome TaxID=412755 RepID=A0A0F9QHQ2_9ZZZZ
MVGINILCTKIKWDYSKKIANVMKNLAHTNNFKHKNLLNINNQLYLELNYYDDYPYYIYDDDDIFVLIEGMIYNHSYNDLISKLKKKIKNKKKANIQKYDLKDIVEMDGEYIIFLYNKNEQYFFILNDSLGRLPFYYYYNEDKLIVSREKSFIIQLIDDELTHDLNSITEYLLFEFYLGNKTLIKNVYRMMPGNAIIYDITKFNINIIEISEINFDLYPKNPNLSYLDLSKVIRKIMNDRVSKIRRKDILISLSGGLDSRGTLALLIKNKVKPIAITFNAPFYNPNEVEYANKIAQLYNIPIKEFFIKREYNQKWIDRNITMFFDGMNPVVFVYEILTKLLNYYSSNYILFSGLWGGEFTRYLDITSGLTSTESLINYLLIKNPDSYLYNINIVSKILDIDKKTIYNNFSKYISNYKEKNTYNKYKHFVFEKHQKWAGEGEDRTRNYFWPITPYFSKPVLDCLNKIQESKKGTLFFKKLLYEIDPKTCISPRYQAVNLNKSIKLFLFDIIERLARNIHFRIILSKIKETKSRILSSKKVNKDIIRLKTQIIDIVKNSEYLQNIFSINFSNIIKEENNNRIIKRMFQLIYTLKRMETIRNNSLKKF